MAANGSLRWMEKKSVSVAPTSLSSFSPSSAVLTIRALLVAATRELHAASPTPRLDAEILLAHVLGWQRARLVAEQYVIPDPAAVCAFEALVARRARLEPVAYLVGHREFYGLDLLVDARVLVPRPETELLVGCALAVAAELSPASFADVGTGSGAVALALAHHLPAATVYATELSTEALAVAAANVQRCGVASRVRLLAGDLLSPVPHAVNIIVSNPPYTQLPMIAPGVARYEPHLALDGGPDGLAVYRRLIAQVPCWLLPGGALLLEIGATQAADVTALALASFPGARIAVYQDLAGWDRVVVVRT